MTTEQATESKARQATARRVHNSQLFALAASFPTIKAFADDADQQMPFDIDAFSKYGRELASDPQRDHAVAFVEAVFWGRDQTFDFIGAYSVWDSQHKAAFFRWCHSPFSPPGKTL